MVENVFLKLVVTNYSRKAVYTQRLVFPAMIPSHAHLLANAFVGYGTNISY